MLTDKLTSKPLNEEEDGDLLYKTPRVVAYGVATNGQPFKVTLATDYAARLAAKRHAELQAMAQEVADEELAFMSGVLAALRSGEVEPITRLTDEQMAEVERERPGAEFSETPFLY